MWRISLAAGIKNGGHSLVRILAGFELKCTLSMPDIIMEFWREIRRKDSTLSSTRGKLARI